MIRPANPADVPRVWELLLALARYEKMEARVTGSARELADHLFAPRPFIECMVAEDGGTLVGYALFHTIYSSFRTQPMMWLEDLFVEPAIRGRGFGRGLLLAVAREAAARGCWRLSWAVLDWNEPAIRFYESLGAVRANPGWQTYQLEDAALRALAAGATGPPAQPDPRPTSSST
jgi:GNAT superfamily N-acetyltransferase